MISMFLSGIPFSPSYSVSLLKKKSKDCLRDTALRYNLSEDIKYLKICHRKFVLNSFYFSQIQ